MPLNFDSILSTMAGAASHELGQNWPQVRGLVEQALRDLAKTIVEVESEVANGADSESARLVIGQAASAAEGAVAAAIVGLQASAQRIVNEALAAVRQTVNSAIGFAVV